MPEPRAVAVSCPTLDGWGKRHCSDRFWPTCTSMEVYQLSTSVIDAIVVGYGPVGLTAALALAHHGLKMPDRRESRRGDRTSRKRWSCGAARWNCSTSMDSHRFLLNPV